MTPEQQQIIAACSKDEAAYQQLVRLFEEQAHPSSQATDIYQRMVKNAPYHITLVDLDGRIERIGRTLISLNPQQAIGTSLFDYVDPAHQEVMRQTFNRVLQTGEPQRCEYQGQNEEGAIWWYAARIAPFFDGDEITHLVVYGTDISERKNAEAKLHSLAVESTEQANLLDQILSATPDAFAMFDRDGICLYLSERVNDLLPELGERDCHDLSWYIPSFCDKLQQVITSGTTVTSESRIDRQDGYSYYEYVLSPFCDNQGQAIGVVLTIHDITANRHARELLRIQRDIGLVLTYSGNLHDSLHDILKVMFDINGVDSGGLYLVDDASGDLNLIVHENLSDEFILRNLYFAYDHPRTQIVMRGKPLYFTNTDEKNVTDLTVTQASEVSDFQIEHLRASASIPIKYRGTVIAAFNLASHTVQSFSEDAREAMETIATQIGGAIARVRAEEDLRARERFIQSVVRTLPSFLYIYDVLEDHNVYANDWLTQITGYTPEELQAFGSNAIPQLIHPDDQQRIQATIRQMLRDHQYRVFSNEYRLKHKNGSWHWVYDRSAVFDHAPDGKVKQLLGSVIDITERKMAEEALRERNEDLNALRSIALAVGSIRDLEVLLQTLLNQLATLVEYTSAGIALLQGDDLNLTVEYNLENTTPSSVIILHEILSQQGREVVLNQKPMLIADLYDTVENHNSVRSWLGVPLVHHGDVLGLLFVAHEEIDYYTERHIDLTSAVAQQAATAIESVRLHTTLEQRVHERTVELLAEKEQTEAILRNVDDAIMFTDDKADILYVNPAWERITGYSVNEAVHMNANDLRCPKTADSIYADLWPTIRGGDSWRRVVCSRRKDGSRYDAELIITPVVNSRGEPHHFIEVRRDVTENRKLDVLKARFISDAAHDLNNPISALLMRLHMLRKAPERLDHHIVIMERQIKHLENLVKDLLTLSRLDRDGEILKISMFDLNTKVKAVVEAQEPVANSRQIALISTLEPGPLNISGDVQQIERVIINLLVNALNYTPAGGMITVQTQRRNQWAILFIEDNGIGINSRDQQRIFERFYRGTQARKTADGTGLGLSIVQEILSQHGGEIEVESTPGTGTRFQVYLPILE